MKFIELTVIDGEQTFWLNAHMLKSIYPHGEGSLIILAGETEAIIVHESPYKIMALVDEG